MKSKSKHPKSPGKGPVKAPPDRDLCGTNPLREQFEPTPALPVRQHYKMAGGA